MSKNSTGKGSMNRLVLVLVAAAFSAAFSIGVYAQNRRTQLHQAHDEARAAFTAVQQGTAPRDPSVGSPPRRRLRICRRPRLLALVDSLHVGCQFDAARQPGIAVRHGGNVALLAEPA